MGKQRDYLKRLYELSQVTPKSDHEAAEPLRTSSYATLQSMFGDQSIYVQQLRNVMRGYAGVFVPDVRAILRSALTDVENGALTKYEFTLLLAAFEDFLIQAKQLNRGGEDGKKTSGCVDSSRVRRFPFQVVQGSQP